MILAHTSHYSPTLIRARSNWRLAKGENNQPGVYRLVMLEDGVHDVYTKMESRLCRAGDIYLIQPGEYQDIQASPGALASLMVFTVMQVKLKASPTALSFTPPRGHLQPSPKEIWGVNLPLSLPHDLAQKIRGQFRLTLSLMWKNEWQHYQANMRLSNILERVVSYFHIESNTRPLQNESSKSQAWIKQVEYLIEEGLSHFSTGAELAEAMNMSSGHFAKKFAAIKGVSPSAYLRSRRLEEARRLLIQSDWSIQTIAEHLKYPSLSSFTQTWNRHHETTPSQYRSLMRGV